MKKYILLVMLAIGLAPGFEKGEIILTVGNRAYAQRELPAVEVCGRTSRELKGTIAGVEEWEVCSFNANCNTEEVVSDPDCHTDYVFATDSGNPCDPMSINFDINADCNGNSGGGGGGGGGDSGPGGGPGGDPGGGGSGGGGTETEVSYLDIISLALAHGAAYPELNEIADKARLGTLRTDLNSVVNATIDKNVLKSAMQDWRGVQAGKGLAILSAAGKI